MKTCPKCKTENQESSPLCKKCGAQLSIPSYQDKKEKVLADKKKKPYWLSLALAIVVIFVAGAAYWVMKGDTAANPKVSSQPKVEKIDYAGQTIAMADIQARIENGKISIPLDSVKDKKIVRFEYAANGIQVPLLAYIAPSGRVVTAVSMCEPCRSTRFHINGKKIVCNACATEWNLETLKGIQGGCLNYPPDVLPSRLENGQFQIDEKDIAKWKPRV